MLTWLLVILLQPPTYRLTVIGGSGSGVYACGSSVRIVGEKTRGSEVFAQWHPGWDGDTAIERVHQRKARLTMPCHDARIEAKFTSDRKRKS